MMFRTHLVLGFLLALIAISYVPVENKFLFLIITTIASSLPDIDHARSAINRNIPLLKVFSFFFRHRGILHSIVAAAIVAAFAYHYLAPDIAYAVALGFLAHLVGDALTKKGIMPFYPITKLRIKGFIRTGSIAEKVFFYGIIGAIIYKIAASL